MDHIVDAPSDDEGDEVEGAKARAAQQLKDDENETRKIARVVAGGYTSNRNESKGRGKFRDKDLMGDDDEDDDRLRGQGTESGTLDEVDISMLPKRSLE